MRLWLLIAVLAFLPVYAVEMWLVWVPPPDLAGIDHYQIMHAGERDDGMTNYCMAATTTDRVRVDWPLGTNTFSIQAVGTNQYVAIVTNGGTTNCWMALAGTQVVSRAKVTLQIETLP